MSRYKYYVDGVLQRLIPQKPDISYDVKITYIAAIGPKDKVNKVYSTFKAEGTSNPSMQFSLEYDLTKPLQDGTGNNAGYKMVYNTKTSAYDARIEDYPAGTQPNPSDWNVVYPGNGTLDDAYQINTLVTLPFNTSYDMQIPYNDDTVNGTFDLALIKYHGDGTADRWDGNQDTTPIVGVNGEARLLYTPPATSFILHENPALPKTPIATIGNISDGTEGDAAQTIQVYFNVEPLGLALGDFTSSASVSLSNLIAVGWDGAGQYIYNLDVSFVSASGSETISLNGSSGQYTDQFNNPSASDAVSNTFVISAQQSLGPELVTNSTFDSDVSSWAAFGGRLGISWQASHDGKNGISVWTGDSNDDDIIVQSLQLTSGKTYRIVSEHWRPAGNTGSIFYGIINQDNSTDWADLHLYAGVDSIWESGYADVSLTQNATHIVFGFNLANGDVGYMNYLSVKEVL